MNARLAKYFLFFAGVLLVVTAGAKLISSNGSAHILNYADPILGISFRQIFRFVGVLELAIALVCLFGKRLELMAGLVAWLSTAFVAYRFGLWWIGYYHYRPCPCLGNLTDALHISPQTADTAMKIILAYLLIGSYATLFWLWRQRKKAISASLPAE